MHVSAYNLTAQTLADLKTYQEPPVLTVSLSIFSCFLLTLCIHKKNREILENLKLSVCNFMFFRYLTLYVHIMIFFIYCPQPSPQLCASSTQVVFCLTLSLSLPLSMRHSPYFFSRESKGLWALCFSITHGAEIEGS